MIALTIAAWCAAIPPTTDDRQHGEGERVRGDVQSHGSVK